MLESTNITRGISAAITVVVHDPGFLPAADGRIDGSEDERIAMLPVTGLFDYVVAYCHRVSPCILVVEQKWLECLDVGQRTELLGRSSSIRVVASTEKDADAELESLLLMGCWGFIDRTMESREWKSVFRTVAAGEICASGQTFTRLLRQLIFRDTQRRLSPRENEILNLVATAKTNKEIAEGLGISEETLRWHLRNLYSKTGLSGRSQMVAYAKEQVTGLMRTHVS